MTPYWEFSSSVKKARAIQDISVKSLDVARPSLIVTVRNHDNSAPTKPLSYIEEVVLGYWRQTPSLELLGKGDRTLKEDSAKRKCIL